MTCVNNSFTDSWSANYLNFYHVEVITFDGESHFHIIEALSAEHSQELAAALHPDADYTMVQGCF